MDGSPGTRTKTQKLATGLVKLTSSSLILPRVANGPVCRLVFGPSALAGSHSETRQEVPPLPKRGKTESRSCQSKEGMTVIGHEGGRCWSGRATRDLQSPFAGPPAPSDPASCFSRPSLPHPVAARHEDPWGPQERNGRAPGAQEPLRSAPGPTVARRCSDPHRED